jgi:hypothetical protein
MSGNPPAPATTATADGKKHKRKMTDAVKKALADGRAKKLAAIRAAKANPPAATPSLPSQPSPPATVAVKAPDATKPTDPTPPAPTGQPTPKKRTGIGMF